jgi:rhomboid protease GluP
MSEPAPSIRETVLRQCLAADPHPWYPRDYAQAAGIDRESLYPPLNDLRVANLVQLTDWMPGKGQGYVLTMLGREVLANPNALAQLRDGAPLSATPTVEAGPKDEPTTFDIGEAARRAIFEGGRVWVVPALILVNLIMFAVSFTVAARSGIDPWEFLGRGSPIALEKVGAVSAKEIARGEWWRLLTNCFLHYGLMHLFLNMTTLFLCRRVEVIWGSGRFLALYLICGVCGSCVGIYYQPGEAGDGGKVYYLAGASGALWGVMASEAVWLVLNYRHLPPAQVRAWSTQMFFTLLLNIGVSMLPGVSAAAHLGGAVAGVLAAFLLRAHKFGPPGRRAIAGAQLAFLPALFLLGLSVAMETDHRLQPFLVEVYREQIDPKIGKLPPALEPLATEADRLFLIESSKRDPNEVAKVREGLQGLVKQAKEADEWVKRTNPVGPARPMKEKGQALVAALVPFAEALEKQAGGEVVQEMNDLRKNWQEALEAWKKTMAK